MGSELLLPSFCVVARCHLKVRDNTRNVSCSDENLVHSVRHVLCVEFCLKARWARR